MELKTFSVVGKYYEMDFRVRGRLLLLESIMKWTLELEVDYYFRDFAVNK